jgi:hypothetical protein
MVVQGGLAGQEDQEGRGNRCNLERKMLLPIPAIRVLPGPQLFQELVEPLEVWGQPLS